MGGIGRGYVVSLVQNAIFRKVTKDLHFFTIIGYVKLSMSFLGRFVFKGIEFSSFEVVAVEILRINLLNA